jgi:hypothetical protein
MVNTEAGRPPTPRARFFIQRVTRVEFIASFIRKA